MAVRPGPEKAAAIRAALNQTLEQASLPVTITVGAADVPLRNLMKLGVGDIVRLDQPAEAPVLLSIGGRPAFLARMGLRGRAKAVQIVERLEKSSTDG
jgi:flagellar motor switch protein FliM